MLVVEVQDTERGTTKEFRFSTSPVRVGRSQLNDLPLAGPYVSHCHGVLHFDPQGCHFVDLGSTNGSLVAGKRLAANVPERLPARATIQIGPLTLRPRVERSGRRARGRNKSYAFLDTPSSLRSAPRPAQAGSAEEHPPAELAEAYQQYRDAWDALHGKLRARYGDMPPERREAAAGALLGRFPALAQEAEFRRLIGTERPPSDSGASAPSARSQRLLRRFAQILIELRRSQRAFRKELSLSLGPPSGPLAQTDAADALLDHLTDQDHAEERLEELNREFADLMLHQVAVLNAVRAGARELLDGLSPATLSARAESGTLRRLFGEDRRWETFCCEFDNLREDSALSARLFGRAFAHAYAAVMGGPAPAPDRPAQQRTSRRRGPGGDDTSPIKGAGP